jgi:hypothetical protein
MAGNYYTTVALKVLHNLQLPLLVFIAPKLEKGLVAFRRLDLSLWQWILC